MDLEFNKNEDKMRLLISQMEQRLNKIYVGGGGANLLHKYIRERINCDLVPDSQIANARGYLKCGTATKS